MASLIQHEIILQQKGGWSRSALRWVWWQENGKREKKVDKETSHSFYFFFKLFFILNFIHEMNTYLALIRYQILFYVLAREQNK